MTEYEGDEGPLEPLTKAQLTLQYCWTKEFAETVPAEEIKDGLVVHMNKVLVLMGDHVKGATLQVSNGWKEAVLKFLKDGTSITEKTREFLIHYIESIRRMPPLASDEQNSVPAHFVGGLDFVGGLPHQQ